MGINKRWLEDLLEAQRALEKETCGCYYDFDDKIEVLCERHQEQDAAYLEMNHDGK